MAATLSRGVAVVATCALAALIIGGVFTDRSFRAETVLPVQPTQELPALPRDGRTCTRIGSPTQVGGLELQARPTDADARVVLYLRSEDGSSARVSESAVARDGQLRFRFPSGARGPAANAKACLQGLSTGSIRLLGENGVPAITVLRARPESLAQIAPTVIERATYGKSSLVTGLPLWIALTGLLVLIPLLPLVVVHASRYGLRAWHGGVMGAVVAFHLLAWVWLVPPFQQPDESVHLHYADVVQQTGFPPAGRVPGGRAFTGDHQAAEFALGVSNVAGRTSVKPPWTEDADRAIKETIREAPKPLARDVSTNATAQPPAFYLAAAATDRLFGQSPLDRLLAGRLLASCLTLGGLIAVGAFIAGVHRPQRWVVVPAALMVGLYPPLASSGTAFNPDALLFAATALAFLTAALLYRRWSMPVVVIALSALILACAAKLTGVAVAGGIAFAVGAMTLSEIRGQIRPPRGFGNRLLAGAAPVAVPLLVAAVLVGAYAVYVLGAGRLLSGPMAVGASDDAVAVAATVQPNLRSVAVFTWQSFLPRLWFMQDFIQGSGWFDLWRPLLVGRFGYLDYGFGRAAWDWLGGFWLGLGSLAALVAVRESLRAKWTLRRVSVVLGFAGSALGLLLAVGYAGFVARYVALQPGFEQARYLLPVAPLAAAGLAYAFRMRALGLGPAVASITVAVFGWHAIAALLLTIERYYL